MISVGRVYEIGLLHGRAELMHRSGMVIRKSLARVAPLEKNCAVAVFTELISAGQTTRASTDHHTVGDRQP